MGLLDYRGCKACGQDFEAYTKSPIDNDYPEKTSVYSAGSVRVLSINARITVGIHTLISISQISDRPTYFTP